MHSRKCFNVIPVVVEVLTTIYPKFSELLKVLASGSDVIIRALPGHRDRCLYTPHRDRASSGHGSSKIASRPEKCTTLSGQFYK